MIAFVNKETGEVLKVKVKKKYIRKNFEELRAEGKEVLKKIYNHPEDVDALESSEDLEQ